MIERPSTIDLIWTDVQAVLTLSLSDPQLSWEDSIGSDHALLRLSWHTTSSLIDHTISQSLSLNTKHLDADKHEAWIADVKAALPVLAPLRTLQLTQTFFHRLTTAIMVANGKHFPTHKPPCARSQPWWDTDCTLAAQQLQHTGQANHEEHQDAQRHLKRTVQLAKRKWAAQTIRESSIWDAL